STSEEPEEQVAEKLSSDAQEELTEAVRQEPLEDTVREVEDVPEKQEAVEDLAPTVDESASTSDEPEEQLAETPSSEAEEELTEAVEEEPVEATVREAEKVKEKQALEELAPTVDESASTSDEPEEQLAKKPSSEAQEELTDAVEEEPVEATVREAEKVPEKKALEELAPTVDESASTSDESEEQLAEKPFSDAKEELTDAVEGEPVEATVTEAEKVPEKQDAVEELAATVDESASTSDEPEEQLAEKPFSDAQEELTDAVEGEPVEATVREAEKVPEKQEAVDELAPTVDESASTSDEPEGQVAEKLSSEAQKELTEAVGKEPLEDTVREAEKVPEKQDAVEELAPTVDESAATSDEPKEQLAEKLSSEAQEELTEVVEEEPVEATVGEAEKVPEKQAVEELAPTVDESASTSEEPEEQVAEIPSSETQEEQTEAVRQEPLDDTVTGAEAVPEKQAVEEQEPIVDECVSTSEEPDKEVAEKLPSDDHVKLAEAVVEEPFGDTTKATDTAPVERVAIEDDVSVSVSEEPEKRAAEAVPSEEQEEVTVVGVDESLEDTTEPTDTVPEEREPVEEQAPTVDEAVSISEEPVKQVAKTVASDDQEQLTEAVAEEPIDETTKITDTVPEEQEAVEEQASAVDESASISEESEKQAAETVHAAEQVDVTVDVVDEPLEETTETTDTVPAEQEDMEEPAPAVDEAVSISEEPEKQGAETVPSDDQEKITEAVVDEYLEDTAGATDTVPEEQEAIDQQASAVDESASTSEEPDRQVAETVPSDVQVKLIEAVVEVPIGDTTEATDAAPVEEAIEDQASAVDEVVSISEEPEKQIAETVPSEEQEDVTEAGVGEPLKDTTKTAGTQPEDQVAIEEQTAGIDESVSIIDGPDTQVAETVPSEEKKEVTEAVVEESLEDTTKDTTMPPQHQQPLLVTEESGSVEVEPEKVPAETLPSDVMDEATDIEKEEALEDTAVIPFTALPDQMRIEQQAPVADECIFVKDEEEENEEEEDKGDEIVPSDEQEQLVKADDGDILDETVNECLPTPEDQELVADEVAITEEAVLIQEEPEKQPIDEIITSEDLEEITAADVGDLLEGSATESDAAEDQVPVEQEVADTDQAVSSQEEPVKQIEEPECSDVQVEPIESRQELVSEDTAEITDKVVAVDADICETAAVTEETISVQEEQAELVHDTVLSDDQDKLIDSDEKVPAIDTAEEESASSIAADQEGIEEVLPVTEEPVSDHEDLGKQVTEAVPAADHGEAISAAKADLPDATEAETGLPYQEDRELAMTITDEPVPLHDESGEQITETGPVEDGDRQLEAGEDVPFEVAHLTEIPDVAAAPPRDRLAEEEEEEGTETPMALSQKADADDVATVSTEDQEKLVESDKVELLEATIEPTTVQPEVMTDAEESIPPVTEPVSLIGESDEHVAETECSEVQDKLAVAVEAELLDDTSDDNKPATDSPVAIKEESIVTDMPEPEVVDTEHVEVQKELDKPIDLTPAESLTALTGQEDIEDMVVVPEESIDMHAEAEEQATETTPAEVQEAVIEAGEQKPLETTAEETSRATKDIVAITGTVAVAAEAEPAQEELKDQVAEVEPVDAQAELSDAGEALDQPTEMEDDTGNVADKGAEVLAASSSYDYTAEEIPDIDQFPEEELPDNDADDHANDVDDTEEMKAIRPFPLIDEDAFLEAVSDESSPQEAESSCTPEKGVSTGSSVPDTISGLDTTPSGYSEDEMACILQTAIDEAIYQAQRNQAKKLLETDTTDLTESDCLETVIEREKLELDEKDITDMPAELDDTYGDEGPAAVGISPDVFEHDKALAETQEADVDRGAHSNKVIEEVLPAEKHDVEGRFEDVEVERPASDSSSDLPDLDEYVIVPEEPSEASEPAAVQDMSSDVEEQDREGKEPVQETCVESKLSEITHSENQVFPSDDAAQETDFDANTGKKDALQVKFKEVADIIADVAATSEESSDEEERFVIVEETSDYEMLQREYIEQPGVDIETIVGSVEAIQEGKLEYAILDDTTTETESEECITTENDRRVDLLEPADVGFEEIIEETQPLLTEKEPDGLGAEIEEIQVTVEISSDVSEEESEHISYDQKHEFVRVDDQHSVSSRSSRGSRKAEHRHGAVVKTTKHEVEKEKVTDYKEEQIYREVYEHTESASITSYEIEVSEMSDGNSTDLDQYDDLRDQVVEPGDFKIYEHTDPLVHISVDIGTPTQHEVHTTREEVEIRESVSTTTNLDTQKTDQQYRSDTGELASQFTELHRTEVVRHPDKVTFEVKDPVTVTESETAVSGGAAEVYDVCVLARKRVRSSRVDESRTVTEESSEVFAKTDDQGATGPSGDAYMVSEHEHPEDVQVVEKEEVLDDGTVRKSRVLIKKQVHTKTIVHPDGQEEVMTTSGTTVSDSGDQRPEELDPEVQALIDRYMQDEGDAPGSVSVTRTTHSYQYPEEDEE
ncbi:PREDICTED: titin-like, partial [Priapulus caudatus]|uniref:Titin-like n=1 Tax=Priapulus caudatus TaxID=37621 RepID=A0ABM1DZB8_PRICU